MSAARGIKIHPLTSTKGGMTNFYTPQTSNRTILVQVPPHTIEDLFVHKAQTDQLLVVKGRLVLVTLINRRYEYVALSDRAPVVVTIPPGVLHGAINLDPDPCVVVNAVLRHGKPSDRDYMPRSRPIPYDLNAAQTALKELETKLATPDIVAARCP